MAIDIGPRIGLDGEKAFRSSLSAVSQQLRAMGAEMKAVTAEFSDNEKSTEALTAKNAVLERSAAAATQKLGLLTGQADKQRKALKELEAALERAVAEYGEASDEAVKAQNAYNRQYQAVAKLETQISQTKVELRGFSSEIKGNTEQLGRNKLGLDETADSADGLSGRLGALGGAAKAVGTALAAAVAAVGAAFAAASGKLLELGDGYNQALNQLSASTGASGKELEALGKTAQQVYTRNFGDSLQDAADGVAAVQKTTGLMDGELQQAAEAGFALRDTFGYDLQESARTANALMQNFGVSAREAYNLIAAGAQNGADQNGDLLDTLNEYAAQYASLGLSAEEFLSGLVNGADAGVFSMDKLGDAVKEFNIRAKDGSDTTAAAFDMLGMDASAMAQRFAAGGQTAQDAFYEVVDALQAMEDPVAQNTAAVNLFGTQFEDLQAGVLPILAGMKDGAGSTYDALSQINRVKYNDLDSAIEGTRRSLEGVFLPAASEVSTQVTDIFSQLGNDINDAGGDFEKIGRAIGGALEEIVQVVLDQMPELFDMGMEIVESIGASILENLPMLIDEAAQIILTLLDGLLQALPLLVQGALQLILSLVQGLLDNLPKITEAAIEIVQTLASGLSQALPELVPALVQAVITMAQTLMDNMDQILDAAFAIVSGLADGILNALPVLIDALPELILTIIDFISTNMPKLLQMGAELLLKLAAGLIGAIPQLVAKLPEIIAAIVTGLGNAVGSVFTIGKDIVSGLWEGIQSMGKWLGDQVSGFFGDVVDGIKGFLGIASPSKVFAELGGYSGEGFGQGLSASMGAALRGAKKEMQAGVDGLNAAVSVGGAPARAAAAWQASPSLNYGGFTVNIYAAEGQDEQEIANRVADRLQSMISRREAVFA